ncbi:IclR family transcriptional regulator [Martelella alba]|uniref:HTH domain-containing protein n=1 Tax=Martelella alba TaxID=2590451 RepID=A0ABY2SLG4_9HYPH|nr:IclR family transcriptional regulator C-terminal domain-containing protein [Martelella alba]TKI04298.1 HTH domain-containing protein [Martelella alba]
MSYVKNGLARTLRILELFERDWLVMTIEDIAAELGVQPRTVYRDVKQLKEAGFLDPVSNAGYTLGPAFVHFDWLLRKSDPLIHYAMQPMKELLASSSPSATVVLCRRYKDCVMCVYEVSGNEPHMLPAYERGVALPLFKGATSKVILAHLSPRGRQRIYLENEDVIKSKDPAINWKTFSAELAKTRANGYEMTFSQMKEGNIGIASPILTAGQVAGSVSLIFEARDKHLPASSHEKMISLVKACAQRISQQLSQAPAFHIARE